MATDAAIADGGSLPPLQFVPWQSSVDVGFWQKLAARKLDALRLSEAEQSLAGHFTPSNHAQVSATLCSCAASWQPG